MADAYIKRENVKRVNEGKSLLAQPKRRVRAGMRIHYVCDHKILEATIIDITSSTTRCNSSQQHMHIIVQKLNFIMRADITVKSRTFFSGIMYIVSGARSESMIVGTKSVSV